MNIILSFLGDYKTWKKVNLEIFFLFYHDLGQIAAMIKS